MNSIYTVPFYAKSIIIILLSFFIFTNLFAKEVCLTNLGKDPVALILSHSMQWVDTRRGRCVNTDDTSALIQNTDVRDECSFEQKTTEVDLITYACFRVVGVSGMCSPEVESWEFPEDCEKRVKREQ